MKNLEQYFHVRGESHFIDDIPEPSECIHLSVFTSSIAKGKIKRLNIDDAKELPDIIDVFTYKDIPGENQIGGIIPDEPLLAENEVHFIGQPIAIIAAKNKLSAKRALQYIKCEYEEEEPILDPKEAYLKGSLIAPSRIFQLGNSDNAFKDCDYVFEGTVESGAQEHLYLETQGAIAILEDKEKLKVYSATQSPTAVQKTIARVLKLQMNQVEVEVKRLGGGFGGKEDQATPWACIASLACYLLKKPTKIVLRRKEDVRYTGKRHPYKSEFRIGISKSLKIVAYEATYYQNAEASADLSTAILERSLFHSTNSYFIPNVKITAHSCKTNLPPFTAFRGFGGPQAMFVIESAIALCAEKLNVKAYEIQRKNLLKENDQFPYGMKVKNCHAREIFTKATKSYNLKRWEKEISDFNKSNNFSKKGLAIMPVCFGISFTSTFLNQGSSLVHIYTDGSVSISTGGVEMGQSVNTKCAIVAAKTLGVDLDHIKIESTNTTRNANTSPTAASTGSDLNAKATEIACLEILTRLKKFAAKVLNTNIESISIKNNFLYNKSRKSEISWEKLISLVYINRIDLSAHGFYAPPKIFFDRKKEKGIPFAYHVYGTAICEATVDILRGIYKIDKVKIVHDVAKSIDKKIDIGQIEGGLIQGIGWMTIEEILYSEKGKILSDALANYKVPDIHFTPEIEIILFEKENKYAVKGSKAVGEPPFMYGIGSYFAILNALKYQFPDKKIFFNAPLTPEKVLKFILNK